MPTSMCDTFWGSHGCDLESGHEGPCICDDRDVDDELQPIGELWEQEAPAVPPYNGPDTWWHSNHGTPTPPQTLAAWKAALHDDRCESGDPEYMTTACRCAERRES